MGLPLGHLRADALAHVRRPQLRLQRPQFDVVASHLPAQRRLLALQLLLRAETSAANGVAVGGGVPGRRRGHDAPTCGLFVQRGAIVAFRPLVGAQVTQGVCLVVLDQLALAAGQALGGVALAHLLDERFGGRGRLEHGGHGTRVDV